MAGKVILLNGASSSGKSSIARVLQARLAEPFWHVSIDHLIAAGVLPGERIRSGEFPWSGLREAFFDGFHRSLPAYVEAGNNLIVEHIVETLAWRNRLLDLLGAYDVFSVGVQCPLDELERRELARGDRPVGTPGAISRPATCTQATTWRSTAAMRPRRTPSGSSSPGKRAGLRAHSTGCAARRPDPLPMNGGKLRAGPAAGKASPWPIRSSLRCPPPSSRR